eukprot:gene2091-20070_t
MAAHALRSRTHWGACVWEGWWMKEPAPQMKESGCPLSSPQHRPPCARWKGEAKCVTPRADDAVVGERERTCAGVGVERAEWVRREQGNVRVPL